MKQTIPEKRKIEGKKLESHAAVRREHSNKYLRRGESTGTKVSMNEKNGVF